MNEPKATSADPFETKSEPSVEEGLRPPQLPARIGRYRVARVLGQGSFGIVCLARDEILDRAVAIKIPRPHLVSGPAALANFLAEARVLASIDHPNIVPVYDFGRTDDGRCYVVSKYVEGSDLASRIKQARLPVAECARVVAVVADALNHAHLKGLVHRDVKPANILIRVGGMPYVCDFGLALRAEVFEKNSNWAGTPAYMSPEQARGDIHLIDGRSDIFSLGIVLYQLLTGQLPFPGPSLEELLEQITTAQVRRPRELDDSIPLELQRICLKALAKPMPERYTTALELAEDLQAYLLQPAHPQQTFAERTLGSVTVLSLDGVLDIQAAPLVRSKLQQFLGMGKKQLVIDFSGLDYFNSAGISSVILAWHRARALDGRVVLAAPSEEVRQVCEILWKGGIFEIYPTVDEAVRSFHQPSQ